MAHAIVGLHLVGNEMKPLLLVALGGALGSIGRHLLSNWVLHHSVNWRFPLGTFVVNIAGCLIVGILGGLAVKHDYFLADTRLFLFTGIVGGFTTFSAFGLETFYLLRKDEGLLAGSYFATSVVVGLLAVWLGFSTISGRS